MSESVLVIDDEKSFRIVLEAALQDEGYEVRSAATGATGLAEWQRSTADLVILDRNLPDADGVEILSSLRREATDRNLDTVFLVVTAYADVENAVEALKRGADDYVTKPVQLSDLVVKLRKALERRRLQRRVRALRHREEDVAQVLCQTRSLAMQHVLQMAEKVAGSPSTPVLIQGESGSGKDMLARYIHTLTPGRGEAALIELNCAAISEQLAETELFGHERGAFTDAKTAKRGLLELAHEGTLFLDEVADLGHTIQAKLLRVLETMRFRRVGGMKDHSVDVRIISATNRDLARAVENRHFRLDLFHRLDVFHLQVPPLRERREDIIPLARRFMTDTARRLGKSLKDISPSARSALECYPFPGNIRELKNLIERAVILESGIELAERSLVLSRPSRPPDAEPFFAVDIGPEGKPPSLRELERAYLERILDHTHGNKSHAARLLEVSFPTIAKKVNDYGIKPPGSG